MRLGMLALWSTLLTACHAGSARNESQFPAPSTPAHGEAATGDGSSTAGPKEPSSRAGSNASVASASKIARLPLQQQSTGVLMGRLLLSVPAGMESIGMDRDGIMAAAEAKESRDRLFLEHQGEKFVIVATETFSLGGDDLETTLRAGIPAADEMPGTFVPIARSSTFQAVAFAPSTPIAEGEAVQVLQLWTKTPDRLVQALTFYVNPTVIQAGGSATDFALSIARSVRLGDRAVRTAGGPRILPIDFVAKTNAVHLTLDHPDGWVLHRQDGLSFLVYRLEKCLPMNERLMSGLGVYVGRHPSSHVEREAVVAAGGRVETFQAMLLGESVAWTQWGEAGSPSPGNPTHREVIRDLLPELGKMKIHVFMWAEDPAQLTEVSRIAESLRVEASSF
jgi:hypothetical protein